MATTGGPSFRPAVAPVQVAIVPVPGRDEAATRAVDEAAGAAQRELIGAGYRVARDDRPGLRPGAKFFHWERHGAALAPGDRTPRPRRRAGHGRHPPRRREATQFRSPVSPAPCRNSWPSCHLDLSARAGTTRERRTKTVDDRATLEATVVDGYALARWCEDFECARTIQETTRATIRCFPLERVDGSYRPAPDDPGPCAWCDAPARRRAIIARAYSNPRRTKTAWMAGRGRGVGHPPTKNHPSWRPSSHLGSRGGGVGPPDT